MGRKKEEKKTEEVKRSNVDQIMVDLEKKFGRKLLRYGHEVPEVYFVPYDLPALDFISGGGVPVGRIIEHYGAFSSTKSYASLKALAQFQRIKWGVNGKHEYIEGHKSDKSVALIDIEGTYTADWGRRIGIDNGNLVYTDPDSIEDAVDIADVLLRDPDISLVVFDSLSAIGDKTEVENSMSKDQMSSTARFWNKAIRKLQASMASNPNRISTLIVINSAYDKVGISFGDPEQLKNGIQLKLAKSVSTKFNALKMEKGRDERLDSDEALGYNISLYNKKNKVGRRGLSSSYYFTFVDLGHTKANSVDVVGQVIDLGVKFGLITKRGSFYDYEGKKYQGMANLEAGLLEDESVFRALKEDVYVEIREFHRGSEDEPTEVDE